MKYYLVLATVLAVCSLVASESNYYNIATTLGQQCMSRVGANDSDVEMIATYQPLMTEVQKKLAHCAYQKIGNICGDFLKSIADACWAYTRAYDGDSLKFINVTEKVQECYDAGKRFDGEDGVEVIYAMYNCYRKQWNQDKESAFNTCCRNPRNEPVFTKDQYFLHNNVDLECTWL